MPTIDVSDIVNDVDLAQNFTIIRSTGQFGIGGFQSTTTEIPMYGTITVANAKDIAMVPEADRPSGAMAIYVKQQIHNTHPAGKKGAGLSDVLVWRNQQWRVLGVKPWGDFGYWRGIAVRLGGQP